ncbi:MAG: hypothetical protein OEY69_02490, partial [Candidatus Krumholzibacteria bacterium]|nr:hypothetical protein [Candidatus Krumholzibacteria bacterium]
MQEAIRVEGITKQYQLGALRHETMLREVLVNMFRRGPRAPRETILALNDLSFHVDEGEGWDS